MQVKRFIAADMRRALDLVRDSLGAEAMILSTRRQKKGVEILATLDNPKHFSHTPSASETITDEGMAETAAERYGSIDEDLPMHSDHAWRDADTIASATERFRSKVSPVDDELQYHGSRLPDAVGLASGKTPEQLADEIEQARSRMLASRRQEKMTLGDLKGEDTKASPSHVETSMTEVQSPSWLDSDNAEPRSSQDDVEIQQIKDDIANMRELLETQLSQLVTAQHSVQPTTATIAETQPEALAAVPKRTEAIKRPANPGHSVEPVSIKAALQQRLLRLGLTNDSITRILASVKPLKQTSTVDAGNRSALIKSLWPEVLAQLSARIPVNAQDSLLNGGFYAFLGATGVGKTTTIAKLAARYVLKNGADKVLLLTTDTYRIAAHHQLSSLGRILNVKVKIIEDLKQLPDILQSVADYSLVLLDTPGMANGDPLLDQHLDILRHCPQLQSLLVVSANSQHPMMKASLHSYQAANIHGCVLTKLDECASLGGAISALMTHQTPLHYVTDGQSVPEDIAVVKPHQLVARCLEMAKRESSVSTRAL